MTPTISHSACGRFAKLSGLPNGLSVFLSVEGLTPDGGRQLDAVALAEFIVFAPQVDDWNEGLEAPEELVEKALRSNAIAGAKQYLSWKTSRAAPASHIPPSGKVVGDAELSCMVDASMDLWLTTGRYNDRFESELSTRLGGRKVLSCNSGSSANLLAVSALTSPLLKERALRAGDEVITAAAGFPTTVNPILQNRLIPVFVDSTLPSGNIDAEKIEAAIGPRTKAIIAAHTLGNPMDMDKIMDIAKRHGLFVIEDCCDALGSRLNGKLCGTFGDAGTLSFYPAHHITMGEGGAVFSSNSILMRAAESFRDWGRDCFCPPGKDNTCGQRFSRQMGELPEGYDHKYTYSHIGFNLKITDMQAACGVGQLSRLDGFIAQRRSRHDRLTKALREIGADEFLILPEALPGAEPSWFGYLAALRETGARKDLISWLEQKGIGTRLLFAGNITRQPSMKDVPFRLGSELTVADKIMNDAFWIGSWPGVTDDQIDRMAETIGMFFGCGW